MIAEHGDQQYSEQTTSKGSSEEQEQIEEEGTSGAALYKQYAQEARGHGLMSIGIGGSDRMAWLQAEDIFESMDNSGDGTLSQRELLEYVKQNPDSPLGRIFTGTLKERKQKIHVFVQKASAFDHVKKHKDGSSHVSKTDFVQAYKAAMAGSLPPTLIPPVESGHGDSPNSPSTAAPMADADQMGVVMLGPLLAVVLAYILYSQL